MGWWSNLDQKLGGILPGGVAPSVEHEDALRRVVPGTFADDFAVGIGRIIGGGVGQPRFSVVNGFVGGSNPSLSDAWRSTDDTFSGWLPGGVAPRADIPGFDLPKWVLPAALAVAYVAVRR